MQMIRDLFNEALRARISPCSGISRNRHRPRPKMRMPECALAIVAVGAMAGRATDHPDQVQPPQAHPLRPSALPRPQPHRTHVRPTLAVPPCRHARHDKTALSFVSVFNLAAIRKWLPNFGTAAWLDPLRMVRRQDQILSTGSVGYRPSARNPAAPIRSSDPARINAMV